LEAQKVARRYVNPAKSVALVTESTLAGAQVRVDRARERLQAAESADPLAPGWDGEYDAASAAVRAAERRLEALTSLRAAQVERGGKRDAAVKASGKELEGIAAGLRASRDQIAAAAAEHLRALAGLAMAVDAHNGKLAAGRARLAALGLAVRDDLVDEGQEHAEGTLDRGVRAGATDWIPVDAGGVTAHALRQVFASYGPLHPLAEVGKYTYRPHEVQARADGLRVPSLANVKAVVPSAPVAAPIPDRPSIQDLMAEPGLSMTHPDWKQRQGPERQTVRST
jgi:hypothetical protein